MRKTLGAAVLLASLALGGGAAAQDADTPLDRSIQKVEARLSELKARAGSDPATIQWLEDLLGNLREEKDRQQKGSGGAAAPPAGPGFDPLAAAAAGFIDNAEKGVDLTPDEKTVADRLLKAFGADWWLANGHQDEPSKRVIRDDFDERLKRELPKKKAQQILDNVNRLLWRPRWGGR